MSDIDLAAIEAAFKIVDQKEEDLQRAIEAKNAAVEARSEAIKNLVRIAGGKKFDRGGKKVTVIQRKGTTYFRGIGYDKDDVISL